MSWFVEPFSANTFMLNALAAGLLVSVACAVAGTYVVLRGLAFMGDALAHGILPGVAAAVLLGYPGILGAVAGAVAMIGGVTLISNRSRLSSDTAIGLLFVGMLALGVLIVSRSPSFTGDLMGILFGELLGTTGRHIALQSIATAGVVVSGLVFARPFVLLCFDPEQAEVAGYARRRYHTLMMLMIALTVVVSFQAVGTLLVFGMLLAPAGAAALFAHRVGVMITAAALIGATSVYLGLLASYHWDLAASASVVVVAVAQFFVVFTIQSFRRSPALRQVPGPVR